MNIQILSFLDTLIGKVCLFAAGMFSFAKRQLPEKFDHIVILKFLGFGSLILAAPALYAVKKRYPGAKIILYTTPGVQKHAGILHLFDEIIVLEPARPLYSIFTLFRLRCRFKGRLRKMETRCLLTNSLFRTLTNGHSCPPCPKLQMSNWKNAFGSFATMEIWVL